MRTNVAIVVDASGSMSGLATPVVRMVNDVIGTLAKLEKDMGQDYVVSLFTFHESIQPVFQGFNAGNAPAFSSLITYGPTALFDAVVEATKDITRYGGKNEASLIITITDGLDNHSRTPSYKFSEFVREHQGTDKFTFVFHLPRGHKSHFVALSGVPEGNCEEWDQTDEGVKRVTIQHQNSLTGYAADRARGVTAKSTYFATTDASAIDDRDLAPLRVNPGRFTAFTVEKESVSKVFAENKTKSRYVTGQLYYQLMKPEVVQEDKQLVLRDKTSGIIFAGAAIRGLLGLPTIRCKVDPGNHASYDVFVQSKAPNRILPRGTKVLIDTHQLSSLPPTWEPPTKLTAAQKKLLGVK